MDCSRDTTQRRQDPGTRRGPGPAALRVLAFALLAAGSGLLLASPLWARPTIAFLEGLPAGKWISIPLPYLPLIAIALGVSLLAGRGPRSARPPAT